MPTHLSNKKNQRIANKQREINRMLKMRYLKRFL